MPPQYIINIQISIIFGPLSRLYINEVRTLSDHINNNPNGIMQFPGPGQSNPKVHINILTLPCWDLNKLAKTSKLKLFGLNLFAIGALLHKRRNIWLHTFH